MKRKDYITENKSIDEIDHLVSLIYSNTDPVHIKRVFKLIVTTIPPNLWSTVSTVHNMLLTATGKQLAYLRTRAKNSEQHIESYIINNVNGFWKTQGDDAIMNNVVEYINLALYNGMHVSDKLWDILVAYEQSDELIDIIAHRHVATNFLEYMPISMFKILVKKNPTLVLKHLWWNNTPSNKGRPLHTRTRKYGTKEMKDLYDDIYTFRMLK
jgi:hypothetical protein